MPRVRRRRFVQAAAAGPAALLIRPHLRDLAAQADEIEAGRGRAAGAEAVEDCRMTLFAHAS